MESKVAFSPGWSAWCRAISCPSIPESIIEKSTRVVGRGTAVRSFTENALHRILQIVGDVPRAIEAQHWRVAEIDEARRHVVKSVRDQQRRFQIGAGSRADEGPTPAVSLPLWGRYALAPDNPTCSGRSYPEPDGYTTLLGNVCAVPR